MKRHVGRSTTLWPNPRSTRRDDETPPPDRHPRSAERCSEAWGASRARCRFSSTLPMTTSRRQAAKLGWPYLSKATCLIRPRLFDVWSALS
jgi:hypothetical protein